MAKIRKIKEKELIGGTSNIEVYPITHTEAVYSRKNQKLSNILDEIYNNVEWSTSFNLNNYYTKGIYNITGIRRGNNDNMPITNVGENASISARLIVTVTPEGDTTYRHIIGQTLILSNAQGLETKVYTRSAFRSSYDGVTYQIERWTAWKELQSNQNVGVLTSLDDLNNFTDNGIYSGVINLGALTETFVMIVINDYALGVSPRRVSQFRYSLIKASGAVNYLSRSGYGDDAITWGDWEITNKDTIDRMITSAVDTAISNILDDAPETFDTLKEIAAWIATHGAQASEMLAQIQKNATDIANETERATQSEIGLAEALGREESARMTADNDIKAKSSLFGTFNAKPTASEVPITYQNLNAQEGTIAIPAATTKKAGVMTAEDKTQLNSNTSSIDNINESISGIGEAFSNETIARQNADTELTNNQVRSWGVTASADGVNLLGKNNNGANVHSIDIPSATTESAGVMSAEDKKKLQPIQTIQEDEFLITDSNGYIVAKIDKKGLDTIGLFVNGESATLDAILENRAKDNLIITDSQGNIVFKIDKDGLHTINENQNDYYRNTLFGKKLVTMGDSLFAGGQFGEKLSQLSGAIWDKELNNNHYSIGGTRTVSYGDNCGQGRAKLLYEEGLITPDFILYENVNDGNVSVSLQGGSEEDESWFRNHVVQLDTISDFADVVLTTEQEASEYFSTNFASIAAKITPNVGTMVGIPFKIANGIRLNITSAPTKAGNVSIKLTGNAAVNIALKVGDTIQDVIDKIIEYNFASYFDRQEDNSVVFSSSMSTYTLSVVDVDGTGLGYNIETGVEGVIYTWRHFLGHDISKWNDATSWQDYVSLWAGWKGLVEYLLDKFPRAMIYWIIPKTTGAAWDSSDFKRADGTLDWDKLKGEKDYNKAMFEEQIKFCQYYEIPCIDLRQESCLTVGNFSTFMNNANVHPKDIAYYRWAEVTNRMLN